MTPKQPRKRSVLCCCFTRSKKLDIITCTPAKSHVRCFYHLFLIAQCLNHLFEYQPFSKILLKQKKFVSGCKFYMYIGKKTFTSLFIFLNFFFNSLLDIKFRSTSWLWMNFHWLWLEKCRNIKSVTSLPRNLVCNTWHHISAIFLHVERELFFLFQKVCNQ
jgi:hypothetical protein